MESRLPFFGDGCDIKIYKVKSWAVYFTYKGEKYLLHEVYELGEGSETTLYRKKKINDSKYELEFLSSVYGRHLCVPALKHGETYKGINKNKFVLSMTYFGLCNSIYSKSVKEMKLKEKEITNKIRLCSLELEKIKSTVWG